jgi:hypothetical protein
MSVPYAAPRVPHGILAVGRNHRERLRSGTVKVVVHLLTQLNWDLAELVSFYEIDWESMYEIMWDQGVECKGMDTIALGYTEEGGALKARCLASFDAPLSQNVTDWFARHNIPFAKWKEPGCFSGVGLVNAACGFTKQEIDSEGTSLHAHRQSSENTFLERKGGSRTTWYGVHLPVYWCREIFNLVDLSYENANNKEPVAAIVRYEFPQEIVYNFIGRIYRDAHLESELRRYPLYLTPSVDDKKWRIERAWPMPSGKFVILYSYAYGDFELNHRFKLCIAEPGIKFQKINIFKSEIIATLRDIFFPKDKPRAQKRKRRPFDTVFTTTRHWRAKK